MNKIIAIVLIALFSASCSSQKSQLVRTWKSDHDLTMGFIHDNVKVQDKTERFLDSLMGHMTLTFTESTVANNLPDIMVFSKGKEVPFKGSSFKTSYKILHQTENQIVISALGEFTKKTEVTTFHFVTRDLMWVYTGSTENGMPDLHAREYYKRVQ